MTVRPTPWLLEARRRQAEFRSRSQTISARGRSPSDPTGRRHDHLLALGSEDENLFPGIRGPEGARAFFKARGIKWWTSPSSGDKQTSPGPTRNLTSSQVACVNFWLPLAHRPDVLLAILGMLDTDVRAIAPLRYVAKTTGEVVATNVELEWVGMTSTLEGKKYSRGAHATSADALVVAHLEGGGRRAYIIEWKFVEKYGRADKGKGAKGRERRKCYTARYQAPSSPLDSRIPLTNLLYDPFYQIMRLALLGGKMIEEQEFGVTEAKVVVVCPEENREYRECITSPTLKVRFRECRTVLEVLNKLWRRPEYVAITTQHALTEAVVRNRVPGLDEWIAYQEDRYP